MLLEKTKRRDAIRVTYFSTAGFSFQVCPSHHIETMKSKLLMLFAPTIGDWS